MKENKLKSFLESEKKHMAERFVKKVGKKPKTKMVAEEAFNYHTPQEKKSEEIISKLAEIANLNPDGKIKLQQQLSNISDQCIERFDDAIDEVLSVTDLSILEYDETNEELDDEVNNLIRAYIYSNL